MFIGFSNMHESGLCLLISVWYSQECSLKIRWKIQLMYRGQPIKTQKRRIIRLYSSCIKALMLQNLKKKKMLLPVINKESLGHLRKLLWNGVKRLWKWDCKFWGDILKWYWRIKNKKIAKYISPSFSHSSIKWTIRKSRSQM